MDQEATQAESSADGHIAAGDENAEPAVGRAAELRRSIVGSALLLLGIGLLGLLSLDPGALAVSMPRSWYIDRALWVAGGLISVGAGWYLLRDSESDAGPRSKSRNRTGRDFSARVLGPPRPRFARVVLYTRSGCHLCEDAQALLERYAAYLPPITKKDIDADPNLIARFSTCVPVVEFDGKVRFRGGVHELLLRRLIAATAPRDTTRSAQDL